VKHDVVIHPDWSVSTPHDLETERVAAAFGGFLSCLELADHTIPAARRWVELQLRAALSPLTFGASPARWSVKAPLGCCPRNGFNSATQAGEHARDARHLAVEFGGHRRQLSDVIKAIGTAYQGTGAFALEGAAAAAAEDVCSRGGKDVTELWYAGMHPRRVLEIHSAVGVPGRLPGRFYLGVMLRGTDLGWLVDTMHAAGIDPSQMEPAVGVAGVSIDGSVQEPVAEWLAWTRSAADFVDPTRRGRWLSLGVSRRMILHLDEAGVAPEDVETLAVGIGRDPDGAARHLSGWLDAGLKPSVADLVRLHDDGRSPLWYVPPGPAVRRLRAELGAVAKGTSDTELGFLLAVAGTVPDAVAAWRSVATLW
jgi:hypothetical protein